MLVYDPVFFFFVKYEVNTNRYNSDKIKINSTYSRWYTQQCVRAGRGGAGHVSHLHRRRNDQTSGAGGHESERAETDPGAHQTDRSDLTSGERTITHLKDVTLSCF